MNRVIFWAVDCQKDFIDSTGKLAIAGADAIIPQLKQLTEFAKEHNIKVVNTMDYHRHDSKELSTTPDFKTTFPEHCMAGSIGAELIPETACNKDKEDPYYIVKYTDVAILDSFNRTRNIIIEKDDFDVFKGNRLTTDVLEKLNPKIVIIYGVASNVCVDHAIKGLRNRGYKVIVVTDAIKELPGCNKKELYESWERLNVLMTNTEEIQKALEFWIL